MGALKTLGIGAFVVLIGAMIYLWGHSDGRNGKPPGLAEVSHAAPKEWSPTKASPTHEVYYPAPKT